MKKRILLAALLGVAFNGPVGAQALNPSAGQNTAAPVSEKAPEASVLKAASVPAGIDESREPSDTFKLKLDGQEYRIVADEPVDVTCKGEKLQALLTVEPYKTFSYGGIELKYPRHFTFEADLNDKDVSLWNLSGSQFVLMIQKYPAEMDHKIMAGMLLPRFGEKNSGVEPCSIELNGGKSEGTRLMTTIGDSTITQEIYSFKVEGGSLLLILQDTIGQKGETSEEGRKFRELLKDTFKINPAG